MLPGLNPIVGRTEAEAREKHAFLQSLIHPAVGLELLSNALGGFDLAGYDVEGYNKFIPYYLFPSALYTVSVTPSSFRTKISVGSNPWAAEVPKHNLASICERYGGGGHARVGAISLAPGELDKAREIAAEIVAELKT